MPELLWLGKRRKSQSVGSTSSPIRIMLIRLLMRKSSFRLTKDRLKAGISAVKVAIEVLPTRAAVTVPIKTSAKHNSK